MKETKIRTAGDIWLMIKMVGGVLCLSALAAIFFVKNVPAAIIVLSLPIAYALFAFLFIKTASSAMMLNVISSSGIKNMRRGQPVCSMQWNEVGDFGVSESTKGIFAGKYIYLSRVFVKPETKQNIINKYDPRVCIVLPCTDQVCQRLKEASRGKIDIR